MFYSLAWCKTSTATQGGENEPIDTRRERHKFLKSMHTEWQTPSKNQAAKVLSLEETAQARERWPDRAMGTRWARVGSQTTAYHLYVGLRHDSSLRVSQILTSSTLNHILRRLPGKAS